MVLKEFLELPVHQFKDCVKQHLLSQGYYSIDDFLDDKVHGSNWLRIQQPTNPRISIRKNPISKITYSSMVDPKRIMSYEDMLKVIHQPEKVIIDVRNADEVNSTGKIPSSINIPLGNVQDALATMSEEEFKKQFRRPKPSASDELIFYCQSGRRSTEALDKALKLGYNKSKTYLGSWNDWSSKHK